MVRLNRDVTNRLARLQGRNLAGHSVESAGGLVRLNGEIDLHPSAIAALSDEQLRDLMAATQDLHANGGVRERTSAQTQALLARLSSGAGGRLRFGYQLAQAERFIDDILRDLHMQDDPLARGLFGNMDPGERARLFELVERPQSRQAAHYALSTHPASVREFANRFEFYIGNLERVAGEIEERCVAEYRRRVELLRGVAGEAPSPQELEALQRDVTQDILGRDVVGLETRSSSFRQAAAAQAERQMAQAGDPNRISETARAAVDAAYQRYAGQIGGRTGTQRINPRVTDGELPAALRALPEVRFSSESAAVYHVQKHTRELPPSERPAARSEGQSYLDSLRLTIQTGDVRVSTPQTGGRSITFVRVIDEGGQRYTMRAIVYVGMDGNVVMATYGGSRQRIRP
jgi:hypothetical protein